MQANPRLGRRLSPTICIKLFLSRYGRFWRLSDLLTLLQEPVMRSGKIERAPSVDAELPFKFSCHTPFSPERECKGGQ